jgi:hypothetical protein
MNGMALRGTPIPAALVRLAVRLARESGIRAAARQLGIDRNTVRRYVRGQGAAGDRRGELTGAAPGDNLRQSGVGPAGSRPWPARRGRGTVPRPDKRTGFYG